MFLNGDSERAAEAGFAIGFNEDSRLAMNLKVDVATDNRFVFGVSEVNGDWCPDQFLSIQTGVYFQAEHRFHRDGPS